MSAKFDDYPWNESSLRGENLKIASGILVGNNIIKLLGSQVYTFDANLFDSAAILLVMQSAVLATAIPSDRLSVCLALNGIVPRRMKICLLYTSPSPRD